MPENLTRGNRTKPRTQREKREIERLHNFYRIKTKDGILQRILIKKASIVDKLLELHLYRYDVNQESFRYVRIDDNKVEEINEEILTDSFFRFVEDLPTCEHEVMDPSGEAVPVTVTAEMLRETLMERLGEYFSKKLFNRLLPPEEIRIKKDTKKEKFLYFRNGYVRITRDGFELLPYSGLDQYIWKNKILDRDFVLDEKMGDYELFFRRICGHKGRPDEEHSEDVKKRILALRTITGYLLHGYFDYKMFAIILTDSRISDEDEPNGRTGKTLYSKSLGKILNYDDASRVYVEINGKTFDMKNKHRYSACSLETQLVSINDVRRNFKIENLFNDITESILVDKKNEKEFPIRAKILLNTNLSIKVDGESAIDRVKQFEFSDYYNSWRSPERETGHWFFSQDWNDDQWHRFDTFIIGCIVDFLRHGVIDAPVINLHRRTLIEHTSYEFVDFMDDFFERGEVNYVEEDGSATFPLKLEYGEKIDRRKLYLAFTQAYPNDWNKSNFKQRRFTQWLRAYAKHHKYLMPISKSAGTEGRSNGSDWCIFKLKQDQDGTIETMDQ